MKRKWAKILGALSLSAVFLTGCATGSSFSPGIFTGVGAGAWGDIVVALTVDEGDIVDITVVSHSETTAFSDLAFEQIIFDVLYSQNTEVDIVTGATASSEGIIAAIQDAYSQASGDTSPTARFTPGTYSATVLGRNDDVTVTLEVDGNSILNMNIVHDETPNWADDSLPQLIEAILSSHSADVDIVTGATLSSVAVIEAARAALAQAGSPQIGPREFNEGTFSGTVLGRNDDVTVTITIENIVAEERTLGNSPTFNFYESVITSIEIEHEETPDWVEEAIPQLVNDMLAAQDANVDIVTGATRTSVAIIEAARIALREASR